MTGLPGTDLRVQRIDPRGLDTDQYLTRSRYGTVEGNQTQRGMGGIDQQGIHFKRVRHVGNPDQ